MLLAFVKRVEQGNIEELPERLSQESVTILIPCNNEGEGILRAINSVVLQNYSGELRIVVLLKDCEDISYEFIRKHFNSSFKLKENTSVVYKEENRVVELFFAGVAPKKDKINQYLSKVESQYLAFLDADHAAEKHWLSESVIQLSSEESFVGVQSRRAPLSLKKLPQLWDSAQNHIGNELVNRALDRLIGAVYFTGTTCVFFADVFKEQRFGDCVTEDTFLSYELLSEGKKIAYNPKIGSNEEVAPDVRSYISRRRRWSCGHNKTFYSLGKKVLIAPIHWKVKAATFIHGLFYTVPIAVCLLLNLYSLHLFVQYTSSIQSYITFFTLVISLVISLVILGRSESLIREVCVLALWIFPQLTFLTPFFLYQLDHELFFFLTLFPYAKYFFWFQIFCLFAPVVFLLVGSIRVSLFSKNNIIFVILSFPLLLFLDLWACLLGFSDFLFGKSTWAKIQRTNENDVVTGESAADPLRLLVRYGAMITSVLFAIVVCNDLTAQSNCGQPKGALFDPALFPPSSETVWQLDSSKQLTGEGSLAVIFESSFPKHNAGEYQIEHFVDGLSLSKSKVEVDQALEFLFETTPGWKPHQYISILKTQSEVCKRVLPFTSTIKELRDKKLWVNGEPFFVKGVIPSFSTSRMDLTLEKGLAQIKSLGANSIRYYHAARSDVLEQAKAQHLLIIDQPDSSTWGEISLGNTFSTKSLRRRFENLYAETRDSPFQLFHTFGNELEIEDPISDIPNLMSLLKDVTERNPKSIFAYSTYFVFLNLPSPILGVNMLDAGRTYWEGGLSTLQDLDKPFYASEFGGFVAFEEWTPPALRAYRMFDYWDRLVAAGSFGIMIHQSHDNWSQPVIHGFNDPLSIDQPDDIRGLWNSENKPKLAKQFVEQLFSDIKAKVLKVENGLVTLELKNIRPYVLSDTFFAQAFQNILGPIDFAVGETKEVVMPVSSDEFGVMSMNASYNTHGGLQQNSLVTITLPEQKEQPVILNDDAFNLIREGNKISGALLTTQILRIVFPDSWRKVQINGRKYSVGSSLIEKVTLPASMEPVVDLQVQKSARNWEKANIDKLGIGAQTIRFKLSRDYPNEAILLLSGLGARKYWIRYGSEGEWQKIKAHQYRENLFKISSLGNIKDDYIYVFIPRTMKVFVESYDHPKGKQVDILFEKPRVFSPSMFEIEKL